METVVIVGGGIAGLSVGYALAKRGVHVTLLDAGPLDYTTLRVPNGSAPNATWAAAGMLAPANELEPTELPLLRLGLAARDFHHRIATELGSEALGAVGLDTTGTLEVALTPQDVPLVRRQFEWQQRQGMHTAWLEGPALHTKEPLLGRGISAGIWAPEDVQVDGRKLASALMNGVRKAGGTVCPSMPVTAIELTGTGIVARAADEAFAADAVVIAAGVRAVPGWQPQEPVHPVRGQIVALSPEKGFPLKHVIRYRSKAYGPGYVVPKADRIVVGSTAEDFGPDATPTAGGVLDILRKAYAVLPGLYDLPLQAVYAGLRPATPGHRPVLAQHASAPVWHFNGLYRHGILQGPFLGERLAAWMVEGKPFSWEEFSDSGRPSG